MFRTISALLLLLFTSRLGSGAPTRLDEFSRIPPMFVQTGEGYALRNSTVKALFRPSQVLFHLAGNVVRMNFVGGNARTLPEGLVATEGRVNMLTGTDPALWNRQFAAYSELCFNEIYPGIDARYHAGRSRLKSEFVVAPGADPSRIRLAYSAQTRIDDSGALRVGSGSADFTEAAAGGVPGSRWHTAFHQRRFPATGRSLCWV